MRSDERRWNQIRPVRMTPGFVDYPEGSVLVEMGGTRVLCNATVENSVPPWLLGSGSGWVSAEYALLPRSTQQRTRREIQGFGGRTQEIRRLIGRSLRAAVDLTKLGERRIIVDCDVLQADGGTRTASITGGYVALALAVHGLAERGIIPRDTLVTEVAAISLGLVDGQLLLDLCYAEDSAATVDLNVVMTGGGHLVEVQGTAEGTPFDRQSLEAMLDLAAEGIDDLLKVQRMALWEAVESKA